MRIVSPRDGQFPDSVAFAGRELVLNGQALCEWGFFAVDLYQAALYLEQPIDSLDAALSNEQTMAIHLDFVRGLTTEQLRDAYSASVRANTGEDFESYRAPLDQLLATMRDVEPGDAYTFIADPDRGLLVQRNSEHLAAIADPAFRRLFLRLYLGDEPPTTALRDGLLGRTK